MTEGYSSAPDGWFTSQCLSEKTLDHHKDLSLVGCEVLARASVNPEGPIYEDREGGEGCNDDLLLYTPTQGGLVYR